jgi:plasmid stability protein
LTTLTIPDVDDALKLRLKARALLHGKSMEAEVRDILMKALGEANSEPLPSNLYAAIDDGVGVDEIEHSARAFRGEEGAYGSRFDAKEA